ncbi:MAG: TRAP transporter large permease [Aminobacterium sp.]|jgi:tripartite ATP-independent transporter DctM subunit|uniref:TRAP transporter large permease n=1 Tax=unclassified Aminobacterium TaxID=2685012 RepID=UPI001BCDC202|nr:MULTISPECIES: TRAP transporter large permease [unclassified Aminobacterium]MDD2207583.1 TRAP transporter large permease [Aminobacterium sp.]MDD3427052.1 TRAP transporter large permease [Aminobacterium sp.]MDD3708219.1 TRAP transporter large permease [Aminobacterium sp.]MDD4229555.1 TRAP transporter large permease [Aminobacterium sp.]MDD4552410.1 TRAP transporter large permease [Aminobacterium sp.]
MVVLLAFLGSLLGFTIVGVPIGFGIGLSALVLMFVTGTVEPMVLARRMITGVDVYTLLAIPFFMLAGEIMNKAGLVHDILLFANALVGRVKGGLAYVNVVASMLFAGISGSAVADTAALGSLEIPMMEKGGYDRNFSTAITAASSVIGPIIPPSVPMIILGSIAQISIAKLFLGGAIPGLLIGIALLTVSYFVARKNNYPVSEKVGFRDFLKVFRKTIWALILPLIILGGILGGIFTATEAGAVAVVYAVVVSYFQYNVKWSAYPEILKRASLNTGVVMLVCASAMALTWFLAVAQVPQLLTNIIMNITENKLAFLLILNILLFLVGMVIDLTPALFLLVPILLPVCRSYGIDDIHFGVIMVTNLCVGLITPPVGTVLYVTNSISKVSLGALVRSLLPMYIALFAVVLLVTYVPQIVLWLPSLM